MKKTLGLLGLMGVMALLTGCDTSPSPSENSFVNCHAHCDSIGMNMDSWETQNTGVCACEVVPDERA